jgi:hypothetical protein
VATAQLNARARPWIWGRHQPMHRSCCRHSIHPFKEQSTRPGRSSLRGCAAVRPGRCPGEGSARGA